MAKKDIKKHEGLSQADLERLELLQKANEKIYVIIDEYDFQKG